MIIEIEGPDGTGKSTQAELLAQRLKAELFRFPDRNTVSGKLIDKMLKGAWGLCAWEEDRYCHAAPNDNGNALSLQLAMTSNRLEHAVAISELHHSGRYVVLDRYWPSGYAYGSADGLDPGWLDSLHRFLPQPDLHILLEMDVEKIIQRLRARARDGGKPMESYENADRLRTAAAHYQRLWSMRWREYPLHWVRINADDTLDSVQDQILKAVDALIGFATFAPPRSR